MMKNEDELVYYSIDGEGQTVILFNGQFMDAKAWSAIVEDLQRYYRVVTFDFPNQGKTFSSGEYNTIDDYCRFFIRLAEKLNINIQDSIAVGFSFGGNIIKMLTLKYNMSFKAIVMGGVGPIRKYADVGYYKRIISQIERGDIISFAKGFYKSIFSTNNKPSEKDIEIAAEQFEKEYKEKTVSLIALIKTAESMWKEMSRYKEKYSQDVYILSARYDHTYVDFNIVEEYVKSINAKHFILDCGHAMIAEDPFGVISILHEIFEKYETEVNY